MSQTAERPCCGPSASTTPRRCNALGACSGRMQEQPLQLLGTDSYGCCCSSGLDGLGLEVNTYTYSDVRRFPECDAQLQVSYLPPAPYRAYTHFNITSLRLSSSA